MTTPPPPSATANGHKAFQAIKTKWGREKNADFSEIIYCNNID